MKLLLALLAVAVVTAHWTHDDSLAREIGPPPGEEDVDVAALSDELISEKEGSGTGNAITYRVTIGTAWIDGSTGPSSQVNGWFNGGSSKPLQIKITGREGWAAGDNTVTTTHVGTFATLRYYQGPFMDYAKAGALSPTLLPGLVPLILGMPGSQWYACSGREAPETGNRVFNCQTKISALNSGSCTTTSPCWATQKIDWCEPNTKACVAKLKDASCKGEAGSDTTECPGVGYAAPPPTKLYNSPSSTSPAYTGLIQRAQVSVTDVGDITEVEFKSIPVTDCAAINGNWGCASAWYIKFAKINTNDAKTGIGSGVYYIHPMPDLHTDITKKTVVSGGVTTETLSDDMTILAKPDAVPSTVTTDAITTEHNAELVKCVAQVCEEELDAKNGLSQVMKDKTEEAFWG